MKNQSLDLKAQLQPIYDFLQCATPQAWIEEASKAENLSLLLTDHLLCELKAAQSAMYLIRKYAVDKESAQSLLAWLKPFEDFAYRKQGKWQDLKDYNRLSKSMMVKNASAYGQDLVDKMVLLIKEELHHFFQVLEMMEQQGIVYENITSSRYAKSLLSHVSTHEPAALVDKLICGAYIEARSCERFAMIAPHMDPAVGDFYISLLRSEARHFEDYLTLAQQVSPSDIRSRVNYFGVIEAELITGPDEDFKFHSGLPVLPSSQEVRVAS